MPTGRGSSRGGRSDGGGRGEGARARRPGRQKRCAFCTLSPPPVIDYKHVEMLKEYMDDHARIRKARSRGTCRRHQSRLATAIKRAREMALLPYVAD